MKNLLTALFILLSYISFSQESKTPFATTPSPVANRYAYTNNGLWVDSNIIFKKYASPDSNKILGITSDGKIIVRTKIDESFVYDVVSDSSEGLRSFVNNLFTNYYKDNQVDSLLDFYVQKTTRLTINGVEQDLSEDREWVIDGTDTSVLSAQIQANKDSIKNHRQAIAALQDTDRVLRGDIDANRARIIADSAILARSINSDSVDKNYGILRRELTVGKWPIRIGSRMDAFGNSITLGDKSTEPYYFYINTVARDMGVELTNHAVGGSKIYRNPGIPLANDTSNMMFLLRRDLRAVVDTGDYLWWSGGTNDINESPQSIGDTTGVAIDIWVAHGGLASHFVVNGCYLRVGYAANVTAINAAQRAVAVSKGAMFINQDTGMLSMGGYSLLDADGIHLTTAGQKQLAVISENQMTNNYGFLFPGYSLFNGNIKTFGNAEIGNGINVTGNVDIVGGATTVHPINASPYYNSGFFGTTYFISSTTSDRGHGGFRVTLEQTGHSYTWDYDVFDYKWKAFKDSTRVYSIDTNGSTYTGGSHTESIVDVDANPFLVQQYHNIIRSKSNHNGAITFRMPPNPVVGETHSFENYVASGGFPIYPMSFSGNGRAIGDYAVGGYIDTLYANVYATYITWRWDGDKWGVVSGDDRFRDAAYLRNTYVKLRMPLQPDSLTTAEMNALTGVPKGSINFCTDCKTISGYTGCNVQFNGTKWERLMSLDSNGNPTYRANGAKLIQGIANNVTIVRGVVYGGTDPDNPTASGDATSGLALRASNYTGTTPSIVDNTTLTMGSLKNANTATGQRLKGAAEFRMAGADTASSTALPMMTINGNTQNIGMLWWDRNYGGLGIGYDPAVAPVAKLGVKGLLGGKPVFLIDGVGQQQHLQVWQSTTGTTVGYVDSVGNTHLPKVYIINPGTTSTDDSATRRDPTTHEMVMFKLPSGGGGAFYDSVYMATTYGVDTAKANIRTQIGSIVSGTSINNGNYTQVSGLGTLVSPYIIDLTTGIPAVNIGSGSIDNTEFDYLNNVSSNIQTQFGGKVTGNGAITGATKTKITYDSKGLVTAGADLSAGDIPDLSATYQPLNSNLTTFGAISATNDDVLQRKAGAWVNRSIAQLKSDLSISGSNTGDQTITLTGDVTGGGTGSFAATIGAGKVTNTMLAGSIAASKLVGSDIATVGTITSGAWNGTAVADAYIASASTWNALPTSSSTTTFTNKRITKRIGTTASSSTPTPDADAHDMYTVTALAAGATFGAPTGTPTDGQTLIVRVKDNGSARSLAFNAIYRFGTDITAPTTTVISKTMYLAFVYNFADTRWDCVGKVDGY